MRAADLASPVDQLPATLSLADGQRLEVAVFVAGGQPIARFLEQPRRFVPVTVAGRFRLIARARIAAVSLPVFCVGQDNEPAVVRRPVVVELVGGVSLRGALVFLPGYGRARVADHLNEDGDSFLLYDGEIVHLVSKDLVSRVEEVS